MPPSSHSLSVYAHPYGYSYSYRYHTLMATAQIDPSQLKLQLADNQTNAGQEQLASPKASSEKRVVTL